MYNEEDGKTGKYKPKYHSLVKSLRSCRYAINVSDGNIPLMMGVSNIQTNNAYNVQIKSVIQSPEKDTSIQILYYYTIHQYK